MREGLPKGWVSTTLSAVALMNPKSILDDNLEVGFIPMALVPITFVGEIRFENRRWCAVKNGFTHFKDGDVIFAKITPCFENSKAAIISGLPNSYGAGSTEYFVLRSIIISPSMLLYWVKSSTFLKNAESKMTGSVGQKRVPKSFVETFTIPLPPLKEQKRIVAKLDAIMPRIDAVKERLDKVPGILKRFRQSVLTAAVTGKLTERWREEHPEVESAEVLLERIKDFRIRNAENARELNSVKKNYKEGYERLQNKEPQYSLPDTWKYCEINSIGNVFNGSTPSRKEANYWNGNINWISSGEVANLRINSTREQITQEGYDNSSVKLFPKGTVLIAMIGEGKTRGQTAILDIESTCNQNIAAVVLNHGLVLSEYLYNWFFMQYERNRSFGSGSGPKALNCQRVREIDFILPPLEEQKEIVRQVEKLFALADKVEAHYKKAKARVDKLSQSVLAKAFCGELVPQDPNDEPAEKLLERILEEKAKMGAQLKGTRKRGVKKPVKKSEGGT